MLAVHSRFPPSMAGYWQEMEMRRIMTWQVSSGVDYLMVNLIAYRLRGTPVDVPTWLSFECHTAFFSPWSIYVRLFFPFDYTWYRLHCLISIFLQDSFSLGYSFTEFWPHIRSLAWLSHSPNGLRDRQHGFGRSFS
jgi:hypothetical protein